MSVGVVLGLVFGLGWLPVFFFRAEAVEDALPVYGRSERLAVWFSLTILTLHVSVGCLLISLTADVPLWSAALGASVFAVGIGFWLWARVLIGPLRRRWLPQEPPLHFRRDGAFAIVRNPLYLGVLIAASGPVVASRRLVLLASLVLCAAALAIRARQEERRLRALVGSEYDDYRRRVKCLLPFIW